LNQLSSPYSFDLDSEGTVFIADRYNHRIIAWRRDATSGEVVAGGNESGNGMNKLNEPVAVIVDRKQNGLIIRDWKNHRMMRWFHHGNRGSQVIVSGVIPLRLAMDNDGCLYVSNYEKSEVL
jgi:hypothetical protein